MPPAFRSPVQLVQGLISLVNGAIALVLLMIAPLGLASVITLTVLIAASTFCCGPWEVCSSNGLRARIPTPALPPSGGAWLEACHRQPGDCRGGDAQPLPAAFPGQRRDRG